MLFKSRNASIAYYLEGHQTVFVALFCLKRNDEEISHTFLADFALKERMKKFITFNQNHGITFWKNAHVANF